MCKMCWKYGQKLVLTPINPKEQEAWDFFHEYFKTGTARKMFQFWHKWCVK